MNAGYSGTPLPKKLGIRPGCRLTLVGAPVGFEAFLGELPQKVVVSTGMRSKTEQDVLLAFVRSTAELERSFITLKARLHFNGGLWIAWPKKSSPLAGDLTEDVIRRLALAGGLVDNKVCAIDETWSGLRLVYRRQDRPKRGG